MGFSVFGSPSRRRRTTLSWLLPRTPHAERRIAAARSASFFKTATPRKSPRRCPSHQGRVSTGRPVPAASAPEDETLDRRVRRAVLGGQKAPAIRVHGAFG